MDNNDLLIKIKYLIHEQKNIDSIKTALKNYHPYDIAKIFKQLTSQERQFLYEVLSKEILATIFEYLDDDAVIYFKEMSYSQGAKILDEMPPDDAVDVLQDLSESSEGKNYLKQMDKESAEELINLSKHETGTAGSIMTTNYIKFQKGTDVKEAMKELGYIATEAEVIDPLFVCDNDKLVGVISLKDLIVSRTPNKIDNIMQSSFVYANVSDDNVSVADKITNYDLVALPILENGNLVGIVTMDDALDIAYDEIEKDYGMLATVDSDNEKEKSFWKSILSRVPWLIILLFLSLLISNITASFEDVIKKITILWFFNTMILDMAGNAATQSLAVCVRKIGRNELNGFSNQIKFILKEVAVVLLNSLILGLFCFGVSMLFILVAGYHTKVNIYVTSLVIAGSMSLSIMLTGILGSIIPLLIHKVKLDPAVASGPLITTVNDVLAMIIYFGLAEALMNYIVL